MIRSFFIVIITAYLLPSCINSKKKSNQKEVKQTISDLRRLGFFENFHALNDEKLFDTLHKIRIAHYSEIFKYYYDPGMDLEISETISLDTSRTIYGDFEDDVCKGNNRYVALLTAFSNASGGRFLPTQIKEDWSSEKGPIKVSFTIKEEQVEFSPEYHDDWLSEKAIDIINQQMIKDGNEKFYMFSNKDGWGLGQYFLYIRLREAQKDSIQNRFGWKLSN